MIQIFLIQKQDAVQVVEENRAIRIFLEGSLIEWDRGLRSHKVKDLGLCVKYRYFHD